MEKEKMNVDENEFLESVEGDFEEIEIQEEKKPVTVQNGILIYKDSENSTSHQIEGDVTLQDLSFYRRYLEVLEESEWKKRGF